MQIVIEIPEEIYESSKRECERNPKLIIDTFTYAIGTGISLPKGHGRLIDADKLLGSDGIIADSRKCHYIPMIDVYQAPTIIEADAENRAVINHMTEMAEQKPPGTFEEMTVFQLGAIATMLSDISKSLAILADKAEGDKA